MVNKYVVVFIDGGDDLWAKEFDDYDEAMAYTTGKETGTNCGSYGADGENIGFEKAYIIRIENVCDQGATPMTITLEPHT